MRRRVAVREGSGQLRAARKGALVLALLVSAAFLAACDDDPGSGGGSVFPTDPWGSEPGEPSVPSVTIPTGWMPPDDPGLRDFGLGRAPEPGRATLPNIPRALTPMPARGMIRVRWFPVEGATGYALYRSTRRGGTPSSAGRIVVDEPFYEDVHAHAGGTWYYAVAALFGEEEGPVSGEVRGVSVEPIPPRQLRITMEEHDLDRLYTRSAYSDVLLPGSATVLPDNDPMDVVGLRFRGAGSRRYAKQGFNIRLDNRPNFNFGTNYRRGGNRILLNHMWTDATGMRDAIGLGVYSELGLPASDTQYVDLYLNGVYEGFYVAFERIDREALRGWNLNNRRGGMTLTRDDMKGQRRRLDMDDNRSTFGLDLEEMFETDEERLDFLQEIWDWRGEQEDHNWEAILELAKWVMNTPDHAEFAAGIRSRFVYDDLLTLLAVHAIFQDTDALDADYWLYRDEDGDQRWRLLPWDKNLVLGAGWFGDFIGNNDFFRYDYILVNPATNEIIRRIMANPYLWADLQEHLLEIMNGHIHRQWLERRIADMLPRVALGMEHRERDQQNFVRHPQQHHGDVGFLPHHLEQIAEYMTLRHRWILQEIDRRNGSATGENQRAMRERFGMVPGQRRCLSDRRGHTWMCLVSTELWFGSASVALVEDEDIDGVRQRYVIQFTQPFDGDVHLYYHNTPGRNWVEEEHWAGDQWRLEMVTTSNDQTRRLRTRVNPFANMVVGTGHFDPGVYTFTLPYGPGPIFGDANMTGEPSEPSGRALP